MRSSRLNYSKLRNRTLKITGLLLICLLIFNLSFVVFLLHLAVGQFKLFYASKPLKQVEFEAESDQLNRNEIFEILAYSNEIGLPAGKSYSRYYHHETPIMYVLSAATPYPFKSYNWNYPLVGRMGYKGFFSEQMALKEKQKLQNQGLVVTMRPVSAFSTLGWFNDPVTTYILRLPEGRRAETLIHEVFHAHIYIKNNDILSENMASHIGEEAAKRYLLAKYGPDHDNLLLYLNHLESDRIWRLFLLEKADEIKEWPQMLKSEYVQRFIAIRSEARLLKFPDTTLNRRIWKTHIPNHADFVVGQQYNLYRDSLRNELTEAYSNNLSAQIDAWKAFHSN
jgi:predicted aminopeptidase